MTTRVKAAVIAPPADLQEAQELLQQIGVLDRAVTDMEADCEAKVTELKQGMEETATIINGRIVARFRALQAYVEVHRGELIPKGRESVAWPAGTVGFRKTPLAVSLAKAKLKDIARSLMRRKLAHCLRFETKIDKDALKAVRGKVENIDGITFSSRTEFFAKTLEAGVEHVGKVKPAPVTKTSKRALRLDWRLAILALAIVALLGARAEPAAGQTRPSCNWRDRVIEQLGKKYGEQPIAYGVSNAGDLVELLATKDRDTWTIIVTEPNGRSCMVGAGEGWRPVPSREEIEGPGA